MKAFELLADKSRWTQGTFARDASGLPCGTDAEARPKSFCGLGAIAYCHGAAWAKPIFVGEGRDSCELPSPARKARELALARHGMTLSHVNDRLGYAEVMEILREADV